jgi:hypothetical protein
MQLSKPERCHHIKSNGAQCGCPALRNQRLCYFHREAQPQRVEVCGENGKTSGQMLVPVFEDATSIQMMVRQVTMLILEGKIDNKRAGLVLYALQTASSNLKRLAAEQPRPVQVVVDTNKVAETPLGMTPWSNKKEGHETEAVDDPVVARTKKAILLDEQHVRRDRQATWMRDQLNDLKLWAENHCHAMEYFRDKPEFEERNYAYISGEMKNIIEAVKSQELVSDVEQANEKKRAEAEQAASAASTTTQ